MAKVTFYKQPDGSIIKETKQYGKVEREYVSEEKMDDYETARNAFAGIGCLAVFILIFLFIVSM
jgi:hypothetical protein